MDSRSLEKENQELKRTLRLMAKKAESNETILNNFFDIEIRLLSCARLSELLDVLLTEFKRCFHLCNVSLILFDPEQAARSLLDDYLDEPRQLRFVSDQKLLKSIYPDQQLITGIPSAALRNEVFPLQSPQVASCALLPLIRQNCLIGSLHLGSNDPSRYTEHVRYDYIKHLASVVSVCIENCINQENLQRLSRIDMLTKVHNRRSFDQELVKELSRASRGNYPLACLFLDLDHFKAVNDSFGHQTGDRVLRNVGLFLTEQLRKTDLVARYGGEEFAILLPNCDQTQAFEIAENLRQKLSALHFRNEQEQPFKMTASVGVSLCQPTEHNVTELDSIAYQLIQAADVAVYQSKNGGRNRVSFKPFTPALKPQPQSPSKPQPHTA